MTTTIGDAIHFSDTPDDLWGSYGIITEIGDVSTHVSVHINGTAIQSLEFLEGVATDTTGLFTRVMPGDVVEPVVTSLRGAFDRIFAQWQVEDEETRKRHAAMDWSVVS